jgi:hypothetical protein
MKITKNQLLDFRDQLIPLLILGLILSPFILNSSGFCFAKGRYLTFDEKMTAVFTEINNNAKLTTQLPIIKGNEEVYIDIKYIPYKSFEEFSKLNPNCCKVSATRENGDTLGGDFWDRITGRDNGEFITMNFKYRYFDKNGYDEKSFKAEKVLTNCGRVFRY